MASAAEARKCGWGEVWAYEWAAVWAYGWEEM